MIHWLRWVTTTRDQISTTCLRYGTNQWCRCYCTDKCTFFRTWKFELKTIIWLARKFIPRKYIFEKKTNFWKTTTVKFTRRTTRSVSSLLFLLPDIDVRVSRSLELYFENWLFLGLIRIFKNNIFQTKTLKQVIEGYYPKKSGFPEFLVS